MSKSAGDFETEDAFSGVPLTRASPDESSVRSIRSPSAQKASAQGRWDGQRVTRFSSPLSQNRRRRWLHALSRQRPSWEQESRRKQGEACNEEQAGAGFQD
jgi:hypothetical protein